MDFPTNGVAERSGERVARVDDDPLAGTSAGHDAGPLAHGAGGVSDSSAGGPPTPEAAPKLALVPARERRLDLARTSVVDVLEGLLARAKAGEFLSTVVVYETETGYGMSESGHLDIARKVGQLEMAKHDLLQHWLTKE
jgi:hypothetical protein